MPRTDFAGSPSGALLDAHRGRLPDTVLVVAAILIGAGYLLYFAQVSAFRLQDLPNHLARAQVMADLLFGGGARFGELFELQLVPMPYLLHDVIFATLVQLLGADVGAAVFASLVLLSLPCALLFYMHVTKVAPQARLAIFALSLFLSTDWFFLMGFFAFRLAIALLVVSLALAERLRQRHSLLRYAAYLAVLAIGYLMHLATPVFFLVVIGVSATVRLAARESTVAREATLVVPVVTLLALHFAVAHWTANPEQPAGFLYDWGRLSDKLLSWSHQFARFGGRSSQILMLMLGLCVVLGVWRALKPSALKSVHVIENLLIALAFLAVYILLPRTYGEAGYLDVRALAMITLFLLIASVWLSDSIDGRGYDTLSVRAFALLLAAANLGWIAWKQQPLDGWMSRYREVAAAVPMGARVLPVSTLRKFGSFSPFLHAGSFLVIDRRALMPYLFSREDGDAMKYFHYIDRPYTPHEQWYPAQLAWRAATPATYRVLGQDYSWRFRYSERDKVWEPATLVPVDWARVACDYDWLLITVPYDPTLIGVESRVVKQNEAAALLAVEKQACQPVRPQRQVRLPTEH